MASVNVPAGAISRAADLCPSPPPPSMSVSVHVSIPGSTLRTTLREQRATRDAFSHGNTSVKGLRSSQAAIASSRESGAVGVFVVDKSSVKRDEIHPFFFESLDCHPGWIQGDSFRTASRAEALNPARSQAAIAHNHHHHLHHQIKEHDFLPGPASSAGGISVPAVLSSATSSRGTGAGYDAKKKAGEVDSMWLEIRADARKAAEEEPALASYIYSTILAHRTLESALASHLANKLASPTLLSSHILTLFRDVLYHNPSIGRALRRDIEAVRSRDPACFSYLQCLLNFKGFLALQVHRVAHHLWKGGRMGLARALQSRMSEVFHVDIHPGAKFGSGILLDHATGLVVGETAEVGDDVTLLHGVTLGGTGVIGCTRHPKLESNVVVGAGARLLGPIHVGKGAKIGAGSIVLQDVAEGTTVVGSPAKEVKRRDRVEDPALLILDYMI